MSKRPKIEYHQKIKSTELVDKKDDTTNCPYTMNGPISAFDEPLNLSYHYSRMYNDKKDVMISMNRMEEGERRKMDHWPFKTKTEWMILQDIFLMMKGLESYTFLLKGESVFVIWDKIQVTHLSPGSLENILTSYLKLASMIMKIKHMMTEVNWNVTSVY